MNNNRYLIILLLGILILVVVYFLTKLYNNVEQFQGGGDNVEFLTFDIGPSPIGTSKEVMVDISDIPMIDLDNYIIVGIKPPSNPANLTFRISNSLDKLFITKNTNSSYDAFQVQLIVFKKKKGHEYNTKVINIGNSAVNTKKKKLNTNNIKNKIYLPYSRLQKSDWKATFKVEVVNGNDGNDGNEDILITRTDKKSGWNQNLTITEITETPTTTLSPVSFGSNNISNKLNNLSSQLNNISNKINNIDDYSTVQITSNDTTDRLPHIKSIINNVIN